MFLFAVAGLTVLLASLAGNQLHADSKLAVSTSAPLAVAAAPVNEYQQDQAIHLPTLPLTEGSTSPTEVAAPAKQLILSALGVSRLDQPDALPNQPAVAAATPTPDASPDESAVGVTTPTPDTQPPAFIVYTVQPGDTIGDLASAYHVSLSSLLWSNPGIGDGDEVSPGQDLRIPLSDGIVYDVQSGDTLSSIAEQFDVGVEAITAVRDNQLTSADTLSAGQTLFIPGGTVTEPTPTATATPEPPRPTPTPAPVATPKPDETPSADGAKVVATARAEIGTPYVSGGASPSGFDCSGLVYWVFSQLGYNIPRSAADQYAWTTPIDRSDLEPGDLVFFTNTYSSDEWITHVGIYTGGGMVVMAVDNGDVVREVSLSESYWDAHYAAAGRPPY